MSLPDLIGQSRRANAIRPYSVRFIIIIDAM